MNILRQQIAAVTARNRCSTPQRAAGGDLVKFCRRQSPLGRLLVGGGATISGAGVAIARRSRLEAVLFLAREPLSLRKLSQLANLADGTEARTVLNSLRERYD